MRKGEVGFQCTTANYPIGAKTPVPARAVPAAIPHAPGRWFGAGGGWTSQPTAWFGARALAHFAIPSRVNAQPNHRVERLCAGAQSYFPAEISDSLLQSCGRKRVM